MIPLLTYNLKEYIRTPYFLASRRQLHRFRLIRAISGMYLAKNKPIWAISLSYFKLRPARIKRRTSYYGYCSSRGLNSSDGLWVCQKPQVM